jgi:hypothetical protein
MDHSGHPTHSGPATTDRPSVHGMLVLGTDTIFMSHLAMFHSPHDYQAMLEVSFGAVDSVFRDDRKAHADARFYTFFPEVFVLPELFPGPTQRTSFSGTLFRHHFEQPPAHPEEPVEIASDVTVDVLDVVHHRRFDPQAPGLDHLPYLLFGKGQELFLAHRVTRPPDFDQLLEVTIRGTDITADMLRGTVEITLPGRPNTHTDRIMEGEKTAARARIGGQDVPVELDAGLELYVDTNDFT